MTQLATISIADPLAPADFWPAFARAVTEALAVRGVGMRDAIVLLPFVQLLDPARRAFADLGGWMPRIETTRTLAAALPPPGVPQPAQGPTGEASTDRLLAAQLLRRQAWARGWERRDARAFDQAVGDLVVTAHELLRAAQALPPADREAWWQRGRDILVPHAGPGGTEQSLARIALEWAASAVDPPSDTLFGLRPAAWVALVAGGADPLADGLLAAGVQAGVPGWRVVADAQPPADPFMQIRADAVPTVFVVEDAEDEAFAAASAVLNALAGGAADVALVAEDRRTVRRIRALLERAQVRIADETGWTLSTTRAGARVMALLRAAHPGAGADDRLDWLKADLAPTEAGALVALEDLWRRGTPPAPTAPHHAAALALWRREAARLAAFGEPRRRLWSEWLRTLAAALAAGEGDDRRRYWADDAAGRAVWRCLRLGGGAPPAGAEFDVAMDLDLFSAWCDGALEQANFTPAAPAGAPQVIITPLARAMLRPFGAVVLPGADERHLGALPMAAGLLGDGQRRSLGLPDRAARERQRAQAFAHLARSPRLTLLRRGVDEGEELAPSPLLERLLCARSAAGLPVEQPQQAPVAQALLQPMPVARPTPRAAGALPKSLSASAVESLRACPYQFFARSVLRLSEDEELELDPDKRDYGTWLHAVLLRFHERRGPAPELPASEVANLVAIAQQVAGEQGLEPAAMLPFQAGLQGFAQRYVDWLHRRDAAGWHFVAGEQERSIPPPELQGTGLHGRIDRIDQGLQGAVQLLDYKTGSEASLKAKVRDPAEDTQLAFYALLMAGQPVTEAAYVALDGRDQIALVPHRDVAATAQALLDGLAHDLARLRAGATLPALGEGQACEVCIARGLCRRDHWADAEPPP